jgi:hypothetical protein
VEVSWAIEANHGGGYQYRLCKVDDPLGAKNGHRGFSLSRPCLSLRLSRACLGKKIAVSHTTVASSMEITEQLDERNVFVLCFLALRVRQA